MITAAAQPGGNPESARLEHGNPATLKQVGWRRRRLPRALGSGSGTDAAAEHAVSAHRGRGRPGRPGRGGGGFGGRSGGGGNARAGPSAPFGAGRGLESAEHAVGEPLADILDRGPADVSDGQQFLRDVWTTGRTTVCTALAAQDV